MRKIILGAVSLAAAVAFVGATVSDAATTGPDLSITGSVAGVKSTPLGKQLPFIFTVTNKSATRTAELNVTFTVTNGAVASNGYVCPLISNGRDIDPDTPSCETGYLGSGKTAMTGVIVPASRSGRTLSVKACVMDINSTDPVPSNNCKTLSVVVE
jgi:hypothetical protein